MPRVIAPATVAAPLGMYSHGMAAPVGELVVVAGQVGVGLDGRAVEGGVGPQTKQALENVRAVVEAAGATMQDVVRLQTFLTRAEDIPGFMEARSEVFPRYFPDGAYPPNTLLVVNRLVRPELLVEIEALAVKPAPAAAPRRTAGTRGRTAREGAGARSRTAARRRSRR